MLKFKNISAGYYNNSFVVNNINLDINKNTVTAFVGKNGTGKSTLAKTIFNAVPFIKGDIYFNDFLISSKRTDEIIKTRLSFFPQGGKIFPSLTVKENLILSHINTSGNEYEKSLLNIKNIFKNFFEDSKIFNKKAEVLSGGEKNQLALSMALINNPELLVLDEPSAGLSPGNVKIIFDLIKKINKDNQITIILIEQNVIEAVKISDDVYLMEQGEIRKHDKGTNLDNFTKIENFFFN